MKIRITESGLHRIVEDAVNNMFGKKPTLVDGICHAISENGIEVNDGSNEVQGLVVNGKEYDLYFDTDIVYRMTSRGTKMTYDYPGEAPEYDYYISFINYKRTYYSTINIF